MLTKAINLSKDVWWSAKVTSPDVTLLGLFLVFFLKKLQNANGQKVTDPKLLRMWTDQIGGSEASRG